LVVVVPPDLKFSDSLYLLFGASILKDDIVTYQKIPVYLKALINLLNASPTLGKRIYAGQLAKAQYGRDPEIVKKSKIDDILEREFLCYHREVLQDRKVNSIFLGASSGASLHLADIMQTLMLFSGLNITVTRRGGDPDDAKGFIEFGRNLMKDFLPNNKNLEIVIHFDPVHDRTNLPFVFHFRSKFWLPNAYRKFIKEHLKKGGDLVVFDVQEPWLHYKLDERFYYQCGGLDDLTPEEYAYGSERIDSWLEELGATHRGGWGLEGGKPLKGYDSEYGNSPRMVTAVKEFAEDQGYNFTHIKANRAHDLSFMTTYLVNQAMVERGIKPRGVIVEQYTQLVPLAVRRLGLLPVWTYYVLRASFNDTKKMLDRVFKDYLDEAEELVFLPTQPFNPGPRGDFVTCEEWYELFQSYPVRKFTSYTKPKLYPIDVPSVVLGPLNLHKRCLKEKDLGLKISMEDIKNACKKFGLTYTTSA
jgi:hypothetical protein